MKKGKKIIATAMSALMVVNISFVNQNITNIPNEDVYFSDDQRKDLEPNVKLKKEKMPIYPDPVYRKGKFGNKNNVKHNKKRGGYYT